jgi:hypothetical protein
MKTAAPVRIMTPAALEKAERLRLPILCTGHPMDDDRIVGHDEAVRILENETASLHVNDYPAAE